MYLFQDLFITPCACRIPICELPFDPAVSRMIIVFQLLTGIRRNIKCIWTRSIFMLRILHVSPFRIFFLWSSDWPLPIFLSILRKFIPYYDVVVEYYILPGTIWMLLWATCAGWSGMWAQAVLRAELCTLHSKAASTRCYTATSLSFILSLFLLFHASTFTSLLTVCQHFPSGGVRHGVRVPGLPACASSHCDLQPCHLSSTCQCRSRPLLGIYTELIPCARRIISSCC